MIKIKIILKIIYFYILVGFFNLGISSAYLYLRDGKLDPVLGTVTGTAYSQANITPEGNLELYLQLVDGRGEPLMDDAGFVKIRVTISIPGIATDDDSPYRELAEPAEEEE